VRVGESVFHYNPSEYYSMRYIVVHSLAIHINVSVELVLLGSIARIQRHQLMVSVSYRQKQTLILYSIVCQPGICKNGGSCYELGSNNYVCVCPQSFTDKNCGTATGMFVFRFFSQNKLCDSSYCLNGGTCVLTSDGTRMTCICPTPYKGDRCQQVGSSELYQQIESFLYMRTLTQ
jgi:hypothetical protein